MDLARQEIRFCTAADGARIAYARCGHGPPLVRAANYFGHLEHDWTALVWRHWHAEFCRDHTYFRYDRRGCGLSDREVEQSLEGFEADLEAVVDAAGLGRFPLLGMGFGGTIATSYAAHHPERVSHLILYGAFARGRWKRNPTARQLAESEMQLKLAEMGWGSEDPAFRQFFTTQFMPDANQEEMRSFTELQLASTSQELAVRHLRTIFGVDVTAAAREVRCPTLVLHAQGDLRVPFDEGRLLASLIPGARFVPLPGRNHFLQEREPAWAEFVAQFRAFLPAARLAEQPGFSELTARERDVLELIARGVDNAQIAAMLGLSEKTVRNHITAIFAKLEVDTRARAIVRAREAGFPHPAPSGRA